MSNCDFSFGSARRSARKCLSMIESEFYEGCLMYFGNRPFEIALTVLIRYVFAAAATCHI